MQVVCIRPFGNAVPGDVAEVPDGSAVDPEHWAEVPEPEPDETPETPPEPSSPSVPAALPSPVTPTEM